jgi:hypothetical protein
MPMVDLSRFLLAYSASPVHFRYHKLAMLLYAYALPPKLRTLGKRFYRHQKHVSVAPTTPKKTYTVLNEIT